MHRRRSSLQLASSIGRGEKQYARQIVLGVHIVFLPARMWRGAAAMTTMQEEELGDVISLTGQELADLVAFAHDAEEQEKLTQSQIPEQFRERATQ